MEKYFVYILKSKEDSSFYIGYTSDLNRRLTEHNSGRSRYTSKKVPWEIFYYEDFEEKSEAIKREKFLKKQRNSIFFTKLRDQKNLVR